MSKFEKCPRCGADFSHWVSNKTVQEFDCGGMWMIHYDHWELPCPQTDAVLADQRTRIAALEAENAALKQDAAIGLALVKIIMSSDHLSYNKNCDKSVRWTISNADDFYVLFAAPTLPELLVAAGLLEEVAA